jgi:MFS family permease
MQGLDTTIVNVCLPHIQGSMSAAQDQISWVLTSYIVASAIKMPLTGWLAGHFGVKYVFLASVVGFTIASALCGAATSLTPAGALSHAARRMQRRSGVARPGHPLYDLPARAPRLRNGDLQHRRDDGADHRPHLALSGLPHHILTQGTALRALMRMLGGSIGIAILETELSQNTQIVDSRLMEHLRPDNPLAQAPYLTAPFSLTDPSGIAALNHEVTRQAAMIAYNDDFALMLIVILASLPLLLLVRSPRRQPIPAAADD